MNTSEIEITLYAALLLADRAEGISSETAERQRWRRQEHELGLSLLAYGLKRQYQLELDLAMIRKGAYGKPYLEGQQGIHFNISHSHNLAVCALGEQPLGVDVEYQKPADYARMGKRIFSSREWEQFQNHPDQKRFFFDSWVKREAYVKWIGDGLRQDLRGLSWEGWGCHLDVQPGYSCALWTERPCHVTICQIHF